MKNKIRSWEKGFYFILGRPLRPAQWSGTWPEEARRQATRIAKGSTVRQKKISMQRPRGTPGLGAVQAKQDVGGSDQLLHIGICTKQTERVLIGQEVYLRRTLRIDMHRRKREGAGLNKGTVGSRHGLHRELRQELRELSIWHGPSDLPFI